MSAENELFPEAVVEYTQLVGICRCGSSKPDVRDLVSMAKKHLSASGWSFYYKKIKEDRKELRYESPTGRKFSSLMTACQWYLANGNSDEAARKPKQEALPNKEGQPNPLI